MCGIFGALARLPDATLDRVSRAMAHRGPDADGRYVDDDLSLVHRRLSIIDLTPTGAQPMRSADGDVIVAGAPWQTWRAPSWEEIAAAENEAEKRDAL